MNLKRRDFIKQSLGRCASFVFLAGWREPSSWKLSDDKTEAFTGKEKFNQLLRMAQKENWAALPIGVLMGKVGLALRGTPYVAATLELYDDREVCSINLLGLDCVTFFENALGFARMLKLGKSASEEMLQQITFTRYRGGKIGDYVSRLHYTADWFYDNERKGVVKIITKNLPGVQRFEPHVSFMSSHPEAYRQLRANPELVPRIAGLEREINGREIYYVPKAKVKNVELQLRTGDILGITTSIAGIDCSHTGLCLRDKDGKLRFLHASSTKNEVTLDDELSAYLSRIDTHTGIMVARPLEVSQKPQSKI